MLFLLRFLKIINFTEVYFTNNRIHTFQVCILVSLYSWNHHCSQDTEHFHHPWKFALAPQKSSPPLTPSTTKSALCSRSFIFSRMWMWLDSVEPLSLASCYCTYPELLLFVYLQCSILWVVCPVTSGRAFRLFHIELCNRSLNAALLKIFM